MSFNKMQFGEQFSTELIKSTFVSRNSKLWSQWKSNKTIPSNTKANELIIFCYFSIKILINVQRPRSLWKSNIPCRSRIHRTEENDCVQMVFLQEGVLIIIKHLKENI